MRRAAGAVQIVLALIVSAAALSPARAGAVPFTLKQVLGYPYPSHLTASKSGDAIAYVLNERGVRNIWVARAPDFKPRQVTHYHGDAGRPLGHLVFSPDGDYLVYVRGFTGGIWSVPGHRQPNAAASPKTPQLQLWSIELDGGRQVLLGRGASPAVSANGEVAFIHVKDGSVWMAPAGGSAKARQLFSDTGRDRGLAWSPDGKHLAFVSARGDHSFVAVYSSPNQPILFINPQTNHDSTPRWSPDGKRIAFVRRPGSGGLPQNHRTVRKQPWSIWIADAATGEAHQLWHSPDRLNGNYPETAGRTNLHWLAGDRLLFLADLDGWPHLYTLPAGGGKPKRLTAGDYMVEDVSVSADGRFVVYNANTGDTPGDIDRRHLYKVSADGTPAALTAGTRLEWSPVVVNGGTTVAFIQAGAKRPPLVAVKPIAGKVRLLDADRIPDDFPADQLVVPKLVTFKSGDGLVIHGQLFKRDGGAAKKPAMVYVHGGPPRQMLLGWHYSRYYANDYAVNQWLANHGYIVLSVNYRLGIGHGFDFHYPKHYGAMGASEYQDVLAGGRYLQGRPDVDSNRIGIWGGSYGGFLTALALARNSDVFAAGVDMHGIHDWSYNVHDEPELSPPLERYQHLDWRRIYSITWHSSPESSLDKWTSPVLLIHGDDDRSVHFHQTVDLVERLKARHIPYELMVIPNEVHDFLRYHSWLEADKRTVRFLDKQLGVNQ